MCGTALKVCRYPARLGVGRKNFPFMSVENSFPALLGEMRDKCGNGVAPPPQICGLYNQLVDNALVVLKKDGQGSWVQVPPTAPLTQVPPKTKKHSRKWVFFGVALAAAPRRFFYQYSISIIFPSKNFSKKFSKTSQNRLTNLLLCGIIKIRKTRRVQDNEKHSRKSNLL